jgi:GntP family gluconate:H+ symporter
MGAATATPRTTANGPEPAWSIARLAPDLPFPVALVLLALAAGVAGGMDRAALIAAFSQGFGLQLGYFALVLLPSFFLAAALAEGEPLALGRLGLLLSPLLGAGMSCPDTAYATLAPVAGERRRAVAAGCYAGFKLLVPAGPLLIGAGLAVDTGRPGFALTGAALAIPVVLAGPAWLGLRGRPAGLPAPEERGAPRAGPAPAPATATATARARRLLPLALLGALLSAGFAVGLHGRPALEALTSPVGALLAASLLAYGLAPPGRRRGHLDAAVRRTAPLLLTIGAATALGAMLSSVVPIGRLAAALGAGQAGLGLVAGLFAVTAAFKLVNGSSMATFAAVPPVLAPVVASSSIDPTVAVYAICLGSFVAVLPNDSYFWLTQPADGPASGRRADFTFTGLSVVQGLAGLACLGGWLLLRGHLS